MAFTAEQTHKVTYYLGLRMDDTTPSYYLERATPEDEDIITGILADLEAVDLAMVGARARLKALKVGSISLPGGGELTELRSEGRRLVNRLASYLGMEVANDVYAVGAGGGSNGGMIRLG